MDRGRQLLQDLRADLTRRADTIKRATYAIGVSFLPHEDGEFTAVVAWRNKDGTSSCVRKRFTRQEVFGPTFSQGPAAWRLQYKPCRYTRELIQHVLTERGV